MMKKRRGRFSVRASKKKERFNGEASIEEASIELEIERCAAGGEGVGRQDGPVVFVPGVFPGDRIRARVVEKRRRYWRGDVVEVVRPSPFRRPPPCFLAESCGGCPWMAMDERAQLEAKEGLVRDALMRIGGFEPARVAPIVPAPEPFGYRTRVRLWAVGDRFGFRAYRAKDVVDVDECLVATSAVRRIMKALREALRALMPLQHLLQIEIVEGPEGLRVGVYGRHAALMAHCSFPKDIDVHLECRGVEVAEDRTSFLPFHQANAEQNKKLVSKVEEALAVLPGMRLLEFFCGDGNMSLEMARKGVRVEGIERNAQAVAAAMRHAPAGAHYRSGDAARWLEQRLTSGTFVDRVLMNPPRAGARHLATLLPRLKAPRLVYVSCDPATLARDLKILAGKGGYRLEKVIPFDMMPQTAHVEALALMTLQQG